MVCDRSGSGGQGGKCAWNSLLGCVTMRIPGCDPAGGPRDKEEKSGTAKLNTAQDDLLLLQPAPSQLPLSPGSCGLFGWKRGGKG